MQYSNIRTQVTNEDRQHAVEVLVKAKRLLRRGWITHKEKQKGPYGRMSYCLSGAINHSIEHLPPKDMHFPLVNGIVSTSMNKARQDRYGTLFLGIVQFNDAQESVKPVLNLVQKAINNLRKEIKENA